MDEINKKKWLILYTHKTPLITCQRSSPPLLSDIGTPMSGRTLVCVRTIPLALVRALCGNKTGRAYCVMKWHIPYSIICSRCSGGNSGLCGELAVFGRFCSGLDVLQPAETADSSMTRTSAVTQPASPQEYCRQQGKTNTLRIV